VRLIRPLIDIGESVSCLRASLTTVVWGPELKNFMIIFVLLNCQGGDECTVPHFPLNENRKNRRRRETLVASVGRVGWILYFYGADGGVFPLGGWSLGLCLVDF
jgi:hypothetical protein